MNIALFFIALTSFSHTQLEAIKITDMNIHRNSICLFLAVLQRIHVDLFVV